MGWPLVKSLLWALVLFVQINGHKGCIEEERIGLLELKAFLKSNSNYTTHLFRHGLMGQRVNVVIGRESSVARPHII